MTKKPTVFNGIGEFIAAFILMAGATINVLIIYLSLACGVIYGAYRVVCVRRDPGLFHQAKVRIPLSIVLYATIIASWLSMIGTVLIALGPLYAVLPVAVAIAVLIALRTAKARMIVACMWVVAGYYLYVKGFPYPLIVYGVVTVIFFSRGFLAGGFTSYHPLVVASFIGAALTMSPMLRFYTGTFAQPAHLPATVKRLDLGKASRTLTWGMRAVYPACAPDAYIILGRYSGPHLTLIRGGAVVAGTPYEDGGDNFSVDCAGGILLDAAKVEGKLALIVYDPLTLKQVKLHRFASDRRPIWIEYATELHLAIIADDGGTLSFFDLKSGSELPAQTRFATTFFALADGGRTLLTIRGFPARLVLSRFDERTRSYQTVREATGPRGVVVHMQLFERDGFVVVAPFFGRSIFLYRLKTLSRIAEIPADYGMRHFVYDPSRKLLIGASYFRGWLYAFDVAKAKAVSKTYIGPRSRDLVPMPDGRSFTAVTSAGAFVVDSEGRVVR